MSAVRRVRIPDGMIDWGHVGVGRGSGESRCGMTIVAGRTRAHRHVAGARYGWLAVVFTALTALGAGLVPVPSTSVAGATGPASGLRGSGSIDEAWLTGARPGDRVTLLRNGAPVPNPANPGTADALGSLIIRTLVPGRGYQWHDATTGASTPRFAVLDPGANPATDSALYTHQVLHPGLNYITMRDGIRLAATVRYPFDGTCSATDPCPTVIEYSGYAVAAPTDPIPSLLATALGTACHGCGDPSLLPDSATDVGAVVARVTGFATVSLQMRGTGCSGGAFDLFDYPSDYDAYDAIEIVAHQDWVAHHKVGMVGISYSGLSQLPAAGTDPPGLAAIAPMSPTDDLFSTGYPGGIFNDGFAAGWTEQRIDDAKPAATLQDGHLVPLSTTPVPGVGQPWTYEEIDAELAASHGTSSSCLANQALHDQSESLASIGGPKLVAPHGGAGRVPSLFDRRSMRQWATRIRVPVFISGALQDEQTGPQWPVLLSALPADDAGLRQSGQRRSHRLDRSTDHQPLARVPRPLCRRPRPDGAHCARPHRSRRLHQLRFRHVRAGPAAAHPLHDGDDGDPGTGRVRSGNPTGRSPLRQRGRCGGRR